MARVNATQFLTKWGTNLSAAAPYITAGVNRVTVAPGVSAASAQDRMLANVTAAITSGAWASRVSAVPLSAWQSAMINKGIPRLQQGIAQAQQTKTAAISAFLSAVDAAVADANTTPRGGLEANIARSAAFQRSMAARAPRRQK